MRKCQKRPTVEEKETYYIGKSHLHYKNVTQYIEKQNKVAFVVLTQHAGTMMTAPEVLKRCLFMLPATNSAKSVALVCFPYKRLSRYGCRKLSPNFEVPSSEIFFFLKKSPLL